MNLSLLFSRTGLIFLFSFLFYSCDLLQTHRDTEIPAPKKKWNQVEELMNIDREFAAYSRDSGMKKAYLEFLDEEVVMLRPNHKPLVGTYALDFVSQLNDKENEVSWEVKDGLVSSSNDLGFTYGIYTVINKKTKDTLQQGTYGMVWKKNKEGMWKVAFDNGNSGLDNEKDSAE
ncbi:MAG: hypothetical protein EKK37_04800 [Sphingobacteriales bacterium]|nr:MAG: hypothetical protein EKK37_04800 [Sphingobacteriales bacterium]